jgi:hypothetical protein
MTIAFNSIDERHSAGKTETNREDCPIATGDHGANGKSRLKALKLRLLAFLLVILTSCNVPFHKDLFNLADAEIQSKSGYRVIYEGNGASGAAPTDSKAYAQGATITVTTSSGSLTYSGYALVGWTTKTDGTGTSYASGAAFTMGSANVTLYAVWVSSTLNVTSSGTSVTITGNSTKPTGALTIPAGVTSIGDSAFSSCTGLTSVAIPSSVTSIGSYAFYNTNLTSISIPSSVTTIGVEAFFLCTSLTSATISPGVTSIGAWAFVGTKLSSIIIPSSVTSIGNSAFNSYASIPSELTSVYIDAAAPPSLLVTVFDTTVSGFSIYVHSAYLSVYESATNWSAYYTPTDYFATY